MLTLPKIKHDVRTNKSEIVSMQGINFSDAIHDGDMADSLNLSARRFPYISTRHARQKQNKSGGVPYSGTTALTAWGKLVAVEGTNLLYDGAVVGQVTAGEKQFAVVNTKMVIWPDKKYLDMSTQTLKALGVVQSGTGAVFAANKITMTGWPDLTGLFKAGDAITISGCTVKPGNNKDIVVKSITASSLTFSDNAFVAGTETGTITLERKIPDMDFICESQNRLWGCSSASQTIYASSLGDPTNFYVYEGLSTDSYALAVGTEGSFTGCCKLASSVLFWKETQLHKILGGFPAEYSLYTYDNEGLQAGCHKSLQVINEVLFYMGIHGVYSYSGGTPSLISPNFGNRVFRDAVAGNDGDSYYLSVTEGADKHLLVYETRYGIWVREDDTMAVDFARIGKDLYFADASGNVWLADANADDINMEWMAQFTPFYETVEGRKRYSKIMLRVELPRGAVMAAEVRCDGKQWKHAGKIVGRDEDAVPMHLAANRCDKFEIRLSGKGPCTIRSMLREFSVGSDV